MIFDPTVQEITLQQFSTKTMKAFQYPQSSRHYHICLVFCNTLRISADLKFVSQSNSTFRNLRPRPIHEIGCFLNFLTLTPRPIHAIGCFLHFRTLKPRPIHDTECFVNFTAMLIQLQSFIASKDIKAEKGEIWKNTVKGISYQQPNENAKKWSVTKYVLVLILKQCFFSTNVRTLSLAQLLAGHFFELQSHRPLFIGCFPLRKIGISHKKNF